MKLQISDLPDTFMLNVFKRINLKERLKLAEVCKTWYHYVHDPSLWHKIVFKKNVNINLKMAKQVIDSYGSEALNELSLAGHYDFDYKSNDVEDYETASLFYLDNQFLQLVVDKCSNLESLNLEYLDLSELDFKLIIKSLENLVNLTLKWCFLGNDWLSRNYFTNAENNRFLNLKSLKLIRSETLNSENFKLICDMMPHLKLLSIYQQKSTINDEQVSYMCTKLVNLEQLELMNTLITDQAIVELSKSTHICERLTHLNLSLSTQLSNLGIKFIGKYFSRLESLYLTSCFGVTNIFYLENLLKLKYLNINNTSIECLLISDYLIKNPHCEVEYAHAKVIKSKLQWTINSSPNSVCSF